MSCARGPVDRRIRLGASVRFLPLLLLIAMVASCAGIPRITTPSSPQGQASINPVIEGSLKDISIASPASLVRAVTTLGESIQGYSSYGLELSYVAYKMIEVLYPEELKPEYVIYPPVSSIYPELFKQVQSGIYPKVPQSDVSFLTMIIPPLAVLYSKSADVEQQSLEALDHAEALNPLSVLPPYLKGVIALRGQQWSVALRDFDQALAIDSSCYPAAIGKAQVLIHAKDYEAAVAALDPVIGRFPQDVKSLQLDAEAHFELGDYSIAGNLIERVLAADPTNPEALVAAARIDAAQKQYTQALARLDAREKLGGLNQGEILLKATIQGDAGNQVGSLKTLADGVRRFPRDKALEDAYGKALVNAGQTAEGSRYLSQSLVQDPQGSTSLEILVSDAIARKDWKRGALYVSRLLELKQDERTLGWAYTIYHALGDSTISAQVAGKLHAIDPSSDQYLLEYIRSLVASRDSGSASGLINRSLATRTLPNTRSMLYYYRSLIASSPPAQLEDLRRALLENLGNEDALVAMARYWKSAGDLSLAQRYADEAQALLPAGASLPADILNLSQSGS